MSAPVFHASLLSRADPGLSASSGQPSEHIQVHAGLAAMHSSLGVLISLAYPSNPLHPCPSHGASSPVEVAMEYRATTFAKQLLSELFWGSPRPFAGDVSCRHLLPMCTHCIKASYLSLCVRLPYFRSNLLTSLRCLVRCSCPPLKSGKCMMKAGRHTSVMSAVVAIICALPLV